jgi:hypothetical protein
LTKNKTLTVPLSQRCLQYFNAVANVYKQTKYKLNLNDLDKQYISALVEAQRMILNDNWEQQHQRYTNRYKVSKTTIENIFSPLFGDCKVIKEVHKILK